MRASASLAWLCVGLPLFLAPVTNAATLARVTVPGGGTPPLNVLVILIDDLGPDQLQCYDLDPGAPGLDPGTNFFDPLDPYAYPRTPNITRIAGEGLRFTRAFASPISSPTRGQMQTGRYPFRNKIGTIVFEDGQTLSGIPQQLDLDACEIILPELFGPAPSWNLAFFGKWFLSRDELLSGDPTAGGDSHPTDMGWPYYAGILRNPLSRPNPEIDGPTPNGELPAYTNYYEVESTLGGATTRTLNRRYLTTDQREDVEAWILAQEDTEPDDPWLAIWSASAVHSKWEWPIGEFDDLHDQGDEPAQADGWVRYNATIEALDAEIGELRAALDQGFGATIWDETLVIVVGDNGSDRVPLQVAQAQGVNIGSYELAHFKGSVHYEGTGIPLIVSGPAPLVTRTGETEAALIDIVDLVDTVRDLAGLPLSVYGGRTIDSQSFLPWLSGTHPSPRQESLAMFFAPNGVFPPVAAGSLVRLGYARWVGTDLYRLIRGEAPGGGDELFHVADAGGLVDPLEKIPLDITQGSGLAAYQAVIAALDSLLAVPDSCP